MVREFIQKYLGNTYVTAFGRCEHPAMKCDYFRLCYVFVKGGFYVDADELYQGMDLNHLFNDDLLKIQPLCYDTVTGQMIKPDLFMERQDPLQEWIYYVNNNPLIAPPNHPVIHLALNRSTSILLGSTTKYPFEIQSTTGPGNLTASLVRHSINGKMNNTLIDFSFLRNWEDISVSPWPLSYRNDERNWRLWNTAHKWKT